ncbi:MAG: glycosyltransferase family 4 protein [Geobacteraceae bacterium]
MLAPTPYFADRGCHVRIYEEARELRRIGHDVRVVTYHLGRDMPGIPTFRSMSIPWYHKLEAGPSWHKLYLDILLFCRALQVARTFRPHILHAHLHEGAFIGLLLKPLLRIPLLFDCQGSLTAEIVDHRFIRKGSLLHRGFSMLERLINRGADCIITSSGPAASDMTVNWGISPGKVKCLMDGVNTDEFRKLDRVEARRALGIPADIPLIVYLGVLNGYQGVDILMEVVKLFKEDGNTAHFVVMGFPDEVYRCRAVELGIADRITFTGRIDYRLGPFFLSAGDIAVSPKISLTEANGKLFNYMACGLPCVVFDTPVNREILGETGVYARYGDAADFATMIAELLEDRERRIELGRQARDKAVAEHSWHARGGELEMLYKRLIGITVTNNNDLT